MVMERLSGTTLAEHLASRPSPALPFADCVDLVIALCDALEPLLASGLAHANLKPPNIMLVPGGASCCSIRHRQTTKAPPGRSPAVLARSIHMGARERRGSESCVLYWQ